MFWDCMKKAWPSELSLREMAFMAKEAGYDFLELSIDETEERLNRLKWNAAMQPFRISHHVRCGDPHWFHLSQWTPEIPTGSS